MPSQRGACKRPAPPERGTDAYRLVIRAMVAFAAFSKFIGVDKDKSLVGVLAMANCALGIKPTDDKCLSQVFSDMKDQSEEMSRERLLEDKPDKPSRIGKENLN